MPRRSTRARSRCLAPKHRAADCKNDIRCLTCNLSGHRERDCHLRRKKWNSQKRPPVQRTAPTSTLSSPLTPGARSWAAVAAPSLPTAEPAASGDLLVHAFGTTQAAVIRSELNEIIRGAMAPLLAEAAALHDWNAKATRLLMQMGDLVKTPSDPDPDVTSLRASQDNCAGICNGPASGMGCDHESASTEGQLQQSAPSAAGAASLCELEHVLVDQDKDAVEEVGLVEASLKIGGDSLEESCVLEAVRPVSLLELPLSPRGEASIPEGVGPSEEFGQVGSGRLNGGSGPVLDLAQDGTLFADDQACDEALGGQDIFLASVFTSPCTPLLQFAAPLHSSATRAAPPDCTISSHGATDEVARSSRRLAAKLSSGLTALEKAKMVMLKKSGAILKEEPTSISGMSKYR
ncbi:hypothetical protein ACQ4PT_043841 [Festuca glaucescens]